MTFASKRTETGTSGRFAMPEVPVLSGSIALDHDWYNQF